MFNEIIALTLIPSLINPDLMNRNGSLYHSVTTNKTTAENITEQFLDELFLGVVNNATEEIDKSPYNLAYSTGRNMNDPLVKEINDEIQRLNLEFSDDELEALENNSEEVRRLIASRQHALQSEDELQQSYDHEAELASGRDVRGARGLIGEETSAIITPTTQFPIMIPEVSSNSVSSSTAPTSTTKKSEGIIGSAVSGLNTESASIFNTIKKPFTGIAGFFRPKKTTTIPTLPPPTSAPIQREELVVTEYTTVSSYSESLVINCTGKQTEYNGACYNVLQPFPCPDGEWIVEDSETKKGKCVVNLCAAEPGKAYFGGKCIKVSAEKLNDTSDNANCHYGMKTYIYKSGVVQCDCRHGFLYNERDGNCYEAYRQRPCGSAQHFIVPKRKSEKDVLKAMCMPNPCLNDGVFCNAPSCPKQRNCAQLGSPCGTENRGIFRIDPSTNTPACDELGQFQTEQVIGNVPTLSCAPGSRRDILGNCRTPTQISFS